MARAAASFDIQIVGEEHLSRKLASFPAAVGKKMFRKAARAANKIVLVDARQRVEVDTGRLQASLAVRALKRSRTRMGMQVVTKDLTSSKARKLGISTQQAFYASFVDLGTKKIKGSGFLRKALYENEAKIRGEFANGLREAIREHEEKLTSTPT